MWSFGYIVGRLYSVVLSVFSPTYRSNKGEEGRKESDDRVVEKKESNEELSHPDIGDKSHSKILYFVVGSLLIVITYGLFDSEKEVTSLQDRGGVKYEINSEVGFTGKDVEKYENGQKKVEEHLKLGKKHGLYLEWYEDGQKKLEGNYKNGEEEGLSILWMENGQKMWESNWKKGELDGDWTEWDKDGNVSVSITYKDGELVKP